MYLRTNTFTVKKKEVLEKMKARIGGEDAKNAELQCPRCDGTLYEATYESITIDVCNGCTGVWLDAGELAQIAAKD